MDDREKLIQYAIRELGKSREEAESYTTEELAEFKAVTHDIG